MTLHVTFLCISIYSLTDVPTVSCSEMIDSFTKLLDEADEFDSIHDVVLQVKCLLFEFFRHISLNIWLEILFYSNALVENYGPYYMTIYSTNENL